MADKTTAEGRFPSPVEILDFWMTFAMRNPTQREKAAQEISKVLKSPGTSYTNVKIALEFYKHVHRFAFNSVIHEPVLESLRTEDILQPEMDPFMSRLLFQSVTNSSTECVEYCAEIWLERLQSQGSPQASAFSDLPNPLEFLDPQSPSRPSILPPSLISQFESVDSKRRQTFIGYFRVLFHGIPAHFYSRTVVAFFLFLGFYKCKSTENSSTLLEEIMLWMETCVHLIATGLMKVSSEKSASLVKSTAQMGLPLHHTLSVLLVSTKAFEVLKVHSDVQKKLVRALTRLQSCSSGFTKKWLQVLRSGIEIPNNKE